MKSNNLSKLVSIGAIIIATTILFPNQSIAQRGTNISGANVSSQQASSLQNTTNDKLKIDFSQPVPFSQVEEYLKAVYSLQESDQLTLIKSKSDKLGFTHYKYQQMYMGLPVEARTITLHVRENLIMRNTGNYVKVRGLEATPGISATTGFNIARADVIANLYAWDADKTITKPKGDLVVLHHPVTKKNHLVYKYDIFAYEPISRAHVYVDANDGEIVFKHDLIHESNVPASGGSLYNGTVNFTADQSAPNSFRLREAPTATTIAIETYSLNNGYDYGAATDITSTTTTGWTDSAAVSAHWGAEQTYDYFKTVHNRNSFDDAGSPIYSFVHGGVDYVNAFWNGFAMTYGDGDGVNYGPLVALDICGHEIAHGVTQYSASLFYEQESGALNESFSDIFGEMVENHASGTNDWFIGTDIGIGGSGAIRSMSDPNLFGQPDTYLGTLWQSTVGCYPTPYNDQCGVHYNSGVQNKWFYILVEGESGTNDLGYSYNVPSIGKAAAEAIAYRNLTVYLNSTSNHEDARMGSIMAAEDLYGIGSTEANAVDSAWKAVGVYPGVTPAPLPPGIAPINDSIASAIPYVCGVPMLGTTIDATVDSANVASSCTPITSPGVWYTFTASELNTHVSLCLYENFDSYDTYLSVFSGDPDSLICIGDNDDWCGFFGVLSDVVVPTTPGETYHVLVHGFGTGVGVFGLSIDCSPIPNLLSMVSDSSWSLSTTVTTATANSYPWPGVPSVPAAATFTLPAVVGQPYPWTHLWSVPGSEVIKAGSGVTYYRNTFILADSAGLNARFRMFVDDNMQIFINGHAIALEEGMGKVNWRTANHDILFTNVGAVDNGHIGGDPFDYYTSTPLDSILKTGTNEIVLAIRNRSSFPDVGGFSFRMDLGNSVSIIKKSNEAPSIANAGSDYSLSLYPNPTKGVVQVGVNGKAVTNSAQISVTDLAGRVIYQSPFSTNSESDFVQINLSGYPAGMYLLKFTDRGETITKSLIKN